MRKTFAVLAAFALMVSAVSALAVTAGTANAPAAEVYVDISPNHLTVAPGQEIVFTAVAGLEQPGSDRAEFVSLGWSAINVTDPNNQLPLTLNITEAPVAGTDAEVFFSHATLALGNVPGVYEVQVTFLLTLDPRQGNLEDMEYSATENFTLTVLGPDATVPPDEGGEDEAEGFLNHGQVVAAWAHWKQGKDRDDFVPGGPDAQHSNVWYKAQVEYMDFRTQEEVWAYLDSIYADLDNDMDGGVNNGGNAGDGDSLFSVYLDLTPDLQSVYQNQNVILTAVADVDDAEAGYQAAAYQWTAFSLADPNNPAPLAVNVLTAPEADGDDGFISVAELSLGSVPGTYPVRVTFSVTLRHPEGGLEDEVFSVTEDFTFTVQQGEIELPDEDGENAGLLNHGQVVSAWAQWKQGKDKNDFAKGGPDVERSKVWYKTQVEYMEFSSREQVLEYLDSIFVPFDGASNNGSGNGNNDNNSSVNNGNNGNGKDKDNGKGK